MLTQPIFTRVVSDEAQPAQAVISCFSSCGNRHESSAATVNRMALCSEGKRVVGAGSRDLQTALDVLLLLHLQEIDAEIERLGRRSVGSGVGAISCAESGAGSRTTKAVRTQ